MSPIHDRHDHTEAPKWGFMCLRYPDNPNYLYD